MICAGCSFCKVMTRRGLDLVSINHNVGIRRFTSTSVGRLRKMSSNKNKSHAIETGKAQMPSTERLMVRFGILSTSLPVCARTKACAHTLSSNSSCSLALALTHGILSLFRSLCPPHACSFPHTTKHQHCKQNTALDSGEKFMLLLTWNHFTLRPPSSGISSTASTAGLPGTVMAFNTNG